MSVGPDCARNVRELRDHIDCAENMADDQRAYDHRNFLRLNQKYVFLIVL
jgi:hypothetical protein